MSAERWNKVKGLLEEVQRQTPTQRDAFLEKVFKADPALGLEVISLIEPEQVSASQGVPFSLLLSSSPAEVLSPDDKVGPYRIIGLIGRGGMGRVYQARDERLHRFVALKFLPEELDRDPRIRDFFLEEARMAAALDHPYICKIYDVGEHAGRNYITMEYVEGETLSDRLARGRPSVEESLRIACEIAEALEKAHQKSVIHRDLKPQNIMLTVEGHVKLMDFGLARRFVVSEGDPQETLRSSSARSNLLVGTLAYMSPEQLRGAALDRSSDIFSFGIVLYEMVAGAHPFRKTTKLETANAITEGRPEPLSTYLPVPKQLQAIVGRMLEKRPELRYDSMRDVRGELEEVQTELRLASERPGVAGLWGFVAAAVLLIALLGGLVWFWWTPLPESQVATLKKTPVTSYPGQERWPAISPDTRQLAFSWNGGGGNNFDIYVKPLRSEGRTRLTINSAQDMYPAWSPDGKRIAFARLGARTDGENGLFIVPAGGGPEAQLRVGEIRDPSWSPDGRSLAFVALPKPPAASSQLMLLDLSDLSERPLTNASGNLTDTNPVFSPDGRLLAFVRWTGDEAADIYLLDVRTRQQRRLTTMNRQVMGLSWVADGRTIVFGSNDGREGRIWKVPVSGGAPVPTAVTAPFLSLSVSPSGDLLTYEEAFDDLNIWRIPGPKSPQQDRPPERLILSTQPDLNPDYSPDGRRLAYSSRRTGSMEIWVSDADGQSTAQLTSLNQHSGTPRWSPDGRSIAFDSRPEGHSDIFIVDSQGRSPFRLTDHPADDVVPCWSLDGKWIYFGSDRTGKWEVFKIPREGGVAVQVTTNGGWSAAESPDRRFLYFLKAPYSPLYRMPLEGGPETVVIPELVFWGNWRVGPEGIYLARDHSFELLDWEGNRQVLTTIRREPDWVGPQWIAVSPDRHWLLYSSFDHEVRDIVLVENFR
jgi:eukaryotic-like serine/threonine-protein kinase